MTQTSAQNCHGNEENVMNIYMRVAVFVIGVLLLTGVALGYFVTVWGHILTIGVAFTMIATSVVWKRQTSQSEESRTVERRVEPDFPAGDARSSEGGQTGKKYYSMSTATGRVTIREVETLQDLRRVWRLTHDNYVAEGYAAPQPDGLFRHYTHLEGIPETAVFIAESDNQILASLSLTLDNPRGLPGEDDYGDIMKNFRIAQQKRGRKTAAFWRLVTAPNIHGQLDIVMKMLSVATERIIEQEFDDVLITVNPKHVTFYTHMFDANVMAETQTATVRNAPGVLLHSEGSSIAAAWERVKARRTSARLTVLPVERSTRRAIRA